MSFSYIDLFAGIGGFRLAFDSLGGECVFSAEIDSHACEMYEANFGTNPYCDITKLDANTIPDFDMLCAGFPCQAFSISGKKQGFLEARGTLFFDVARILKEKNPPVFILENVKNLIYHDGGNTFRTILNILVGLDYQVSWSVLNAKDYSVPQNRERVFIVGSKTRIFDFSKVEKTPCMSMRSILESNVSEYLPESEYTLISNPKQNESGLIFVGYRNKPMRQRGVRPNTKHLSRVHKQCNRIYSADGTHPTISSSETSGRYFIHDGIGVRKLTLNECYRLFCFPDDFIRTGAVTNQYRRVGNSVCVPVVKAIAKQMIEQFMER